MLAKYPKKTQTFHQYDKKSSLERHPLGKREEPSLNPKEKYRKIDEIHKLMDEVFFIDETKQSERKPTVRPWVGKGGKWARKRNDEGGVPCERKNAVLRLEVKGKSFGLLGLQNRFPNMFSQIRFLGSYSLGTENRIDSNWVRILEIVYGLVSMGIDFQTYF